MNEERLIKEYFEWERVREQLLYSNDERAYEDVCEKLEDIKDEMLTLIDFYNVEFSKLSCTNKEELEKAKDLNNKLIKLEACFR